MTAHFPHRPRRAFPWRAAALACGLALVLAAGCTPHRELYPRLDGLARAGKYAEAAQLVEKNRETYGERNEVLYNLDRGVFLHYAGEYRKSNQAFEAAERRLDELFTRSVSGEVGAFLSNDNTLPYRGEDYEAVVVNIYRALNYVMLGQKDEALVEARKVDLKLDLINRAYAPGEKNVYKEDAFARYLMGVLYEQGGTRDDLNDAYISNRLAASIYEKDFARHYSVDVPDTLKVNLLTTARFMGREELERARQKFPNVPLLEPELKREQGELYFVHYAGRAPDKVEDAIMAHMPDGYLLRIAFPRYRRRSYLVTGSRVVVNGSVAARLEEAEPIGDIAIQSLANRKGRIQAKAIARATTKYLATRAASQAARRDSELAGALTFLAGNVASAVSEQADLRAWETLPDRILMGRVLLAPGTYRIQVQFTGAGGVVSTRDLGQVQVEAGRTRFFILHTNS